jgi:hypothetical protein
MSRRAPRDGLAHEPRRTAKIRYGKRRAILWLPSRRILAQGREKGVLFAGAGELKRQKKKTPAFAPGLQVTPVRLKSWRIEPDCYSR